MFLRIHTKLMLASVAIFIFLASVSGIVAYYNQRIMQKSMGRHTRVQKELNMIRNLQLALTVDMILMPANDYIITGDRKYIENFEKSSRDLEARLKEAEGILADMDESTHPKVKEEREIIKDVNIAWRNIKEVSRKIFTMPNPVGSNKAAMLMEEIDYKWGYPAMERLKTWEEIENREFREAAEEVERVGGLSWIIITVVTVTALFLIIVFVFFLAKHVVNPIEVIHKRADAIARGDFKERLTIKSQDEIGLLANAMNTMADQLSSLYHNLEEAVADRTKKLNERIEELERFSKATIRRELRMKELKDRIKVMEGELNNAKGGKS